MCVFSPGLSFPQPLVQFPGVSRSNQDWARNAELDPGLPHRVCCNRELECKVGPGRKPPGTWTWTSSETAKLPTHTVHQGCVFVVRFVPTCTGSWGVSVKAEGDGEGKDNPFRARRKYPFRPVRELGCGTLGFEGCLLYLYTCDPRTRLPTNLWLTQILQGARKLAFLLGIPSISQWTPAGSSLQPEPTQPTLSHLPVLTWVSHLGTAPAGPAQPCACSDTQRPSREVRAPREVPTRGSGRAPRGARARAAGCPRGTSLPCPRFLPGR